MKLSYIFQLEKFITMFFIGFSVGIMYGILKNTINIKKNIVIQTIIDTLITISAAIILIILINIINMGEIRLYLLISYFLGILIERITFGKLFAKGFKFVYTKIVSMAKIIANSKFGRFLFK